MRAAVIDTDSIVRNIILLDGDTAFDPGYGLSLIMIDRDVSCDIGQRHLSGSVPPVFADLAPASSDQAMTMAEALEQASKAVALAQYSLAAALKLG